MSGNNRNLIIGIAVIAIVAVGAVAFIFLSTPPAEEQVRYAFLLPGSITDSGWNAQMFVSAQNAEEVLDIQVTVAYGLGQTGVLSIYQEYVDQGYDVVWGHTIQYVDPANQIAENNPDVWFPGSTFYYRDFPNVISFPGAMHEGAYICGMYAGGITNSGKVGMIGGFNYGTQVAIANSFYIGANMTYFARTGNNINMSVIWGGVWDDVDKGREAGEALLSAGVDIALARGNGLTLGAIQAFAVSNTTYMFGDIAEQSALASNTILGSNYFNFTVQIMKFDEMRIAGTLSNATPYVYGILENENLCVLNPAFDATFWNSNQANLTAWVAAEIALRKANTTQWPEILTPLY